MRHFCIFPLKNFILIEIHELNTGLANNFQWLKWYTQCDNFLICIYDNFLICIYVWLGYRDVYIPYIPSYHHNSSSEIFPSLFFPVIFLLQCWQPKKGQTLLWQIPVMSDITLCSIVAVFYVFFQILSCWSNIMWHTRISLSMSVCNLGGSFLLFPAVGCSFLLYRFPPFLSLFCFISFQD